ncbi:MAG: MBL fold metallo-hydrolase [Candidatus Aminicenantales bacterium]
MKVKFWGVRGTCPVSGRDYVEYGGHTLCASLEISEEEFVIIDAGTGMRRLGESLQEANRKKPLSFHIFLTHFHLDHIMGIPFFDPLYSPENRLIFYAPASPDETQEYLNALMGSRFFPVEFRKALSRKTFRKAPEKDFQIGPTLISSCPLHHPQGSVAYRIKADRGSVVFATDTEHPAEGLDQRLISFVRGADALVYDAMYTPAEYEAEKRGWGHSTWLEGTKVAREAAVRNLYLSHFNPSHSDSQIDEFIDLARKEFPRTSGAREGLLVFF